ncbi:MAG TPA: HAMP domain-containing sensor histidine kinase [Kofleriaceae bacterium]|nr:HAMP domain-containing sensor histidine kinase [Kofleriaceae bacterium]
MKRERLGARLATWAAATTAAALLCFGLIAAVVVWAHERGEEDEESPVAEALSQVGPTLVIAGPAVLGLAYIVTRRLARRLTGRIDRVIDAARRITHEDLRDRLPVSPAGDELDELTASLNAVFARIDDDLAAQRQFVSDASHELRTPLAVLRSDLEIARRRPRTTEEWEQTADRAREEVARMTAMVEALLRLARAGVEAPRDERVAARVLLDAVAARWSTAAHAAGVELAVESDDASVTGDADALAVALGNLVANAVAHSSRGGAVRLAARRAEDGVELTVADQGPGVAAADRDRIFQAFARGRTTADRRGDGGVGLGLSVARRILEAHGGALHLDPAPPPGARFVARLPAA